MSESAWLLEGEIMTADGSRIAYITDAMPPSLSGDHTTITFDPNEARRFSCQNDADAFRLKHFGFPSRSRCPYCGRDPGDGRLLTFHATEHAWPVVGEKAE